MILTNHGKTDVGAEQQKFTLGKIYDTCGFENNDETERDERIDATDHQAVNHQL